MITIRIALLFFIFFVGMPLAQAQPESLINRIETSIKRAKSPDRKAHLYRQMGDLFSEHKKYMTAIENYEKSLKFYEKALKKEGDKLAAEVLLVYIRKGYAHLQLSELNTALKTYQDAILLYPEASYEDPPLLYNLGILYYNIGLVEQDLNNGSKALKAYLNSLKYREQLVTSTPEQLPVLLQTSDKAKLLIHYEENPEKVSQQLEKVKNTISQLENIRPSEKEEAIAEINLILGESYNFYNKEKSRPYFETAVKKYAALEKSEADFNRLNQAFAHVQLGITEKQDKNYAAAASQFHRALYLFQKLLKENNDEYYKIRVSNCYSNLALVLSLAGDNDEVKKYYSKYLEELKKWATDDPNQFITLYCNKLNSYGLFLHQQGESQKALDFLSEAKRIIKPYAEKNPSDYLSAYNNYNNDLIYTLWESGDYDLTIMMLEQKFDFNILFVGKYPAAAPGVIQTLTDQINFNIEQYNKTINSELIQKTEAAFQQVSDLFSTHRKSLGSELETFYEQELLELDLEVSNMEGFGKAHHAIAKALAQKDYQTAVAGQQKIIRIWELIEESKSKLQNQKIILANRALHEGSLAWYHLLAQDFKAAEAAARQSLELNTQGTWVNTNLAAALLFQRKWAEAQEIYLEWADKDYGDDQTFREVFLADLLEFEEAGLPAEAIEKARDWLGD